VIKYEVPLDHDVDLVISNDKEALFEIRFFNKMTVAKQVELLKQVVKQLKVNLCKPNPHIHLKNGSVVDVKEVGKGLTYLNVLTIEDEWINCTRKQPNCYYASRRKW